MVLAPTACSLYLGLGWFKHTCKCQVLIFSFLLSFYFCFLVCSITHRVEPNRTNQKNRTGSLIQIQQTDSSVLNNALLLQTKTHLAEVKKQVWVSVMKSSNTFYRSDDMNPAFNAALVIGSSSAKHFDGASSCWDRDMRQWALISADTGVSFHKSEMWR